MIPRPRLRPLSALSRGWQRQQQQQQQQWPARPSSSSSASPARPNTTDQQDLPAPPPQRWLSDLHARLGKCIMFGCTPAQVTEAGAVLRALAGEWRALSAGAEGFLTGGGGGLRGLEGQQVVWGEQDSFRHVNNVQYVRWAESSRVNWATHLARAQRDPERARRWAQLMTPDAVGLILKSIRVDYKMPLTYPDRVSVYHRLRFPPSSPEQQRRPSSLVLDAAVFSHRHRRVCARVEEDVVIYDYRAARKTDMPPFMRDVLEETFAAQLRETARARRRVWELVRAVEALEGGTWDRPDAVEDLGGAAGVGTK
ncbi:hypothetical protein KVR01_009272 [Diaporthe batatas]|uniref:uncharacterized protein n=1 Tax=Diaporthe batatas TaxID=748121 RepID=UPI001D052A5F|nr:uncharacterized protein KVR01_009272 [Diaporthe batatas]KAG8161008.1 hypothetical protein KVR01_009272 [Diaporthe batatas]